MSVFVIVAVGALLVLGYVRFAPSDPARWHVPIAASADKDMKAGAIRVIRAGPEALMRADAALRALPRTTHLAGSVEEGRVTYVTRSRVIGFPDYTTIEYADGMLKMYARLRFGLSDLGVNRKRLERLLAVIER